MPAGIIIDIPARFLQQSATSMMPIEQRLQAAQGYLQLGMIEDANHELDAVPADLKNSPQVLGIRALIYHETDSWQLLRDTGGYLVEHWPEDSQHWIWFAYGTRRCRSIADAEGILLDALRFHDAEPIIHFNLACYAAQTGNLEIARERLVKACQLDPGVHLLAMADPDLEPFWQELGRNPPTLDGIPPP